MTVNQLLQTIKQRIATLDEKQRMILAGACLLFAALTALLIWYHNREDAVVMQPAAVRDPLQVADQLNISKEKAKDIVRAIENTTAKPPLMSWTVPASNTQEAAKAVKKQIENKTAPPLPPADKTIVTPRETKVDVYRIDMDANWEIGIGYGNHDGDSYIPVEIQRNYSKHKAIAAEVHMDMGMKKVKGYEIKHIWRF